MEFPKPVMRLTALVEMGFPQEYLMRIYRTKGQTIARKINPNKEKSPIIFDTKGLEDWWNKGK